MTKYFQIYWRFFSTLSNPGRFLWLAIMAAVSMFAFLLNKYVFGDTELGVYLALLPSIIILVPIRMSTISPSSRIHKD